MIFRKHPPALPSRRAHPDPRVEAELQRIISLQRLAARKQELLDESYAKVIHVRGKAANNAANPYNVYRLSMASDLLDEAGGVEAEVRNLHEEIAAALAALDDSDVAYLA